MTGRLFIVERGYSSWSVVIHRGAWLFMVIHGYSWLFMVIHGYSWLFMVERESTCLQAKMRG
jgi:hypothetical protein